MTNLRHLLSKAGTVYHGMISDLSERFVVKIIFFVEKASLNLCLRLYIQTHLLKGPDEGTVQTKKCWMTPTKNIDDELSYTIIDNL